MASNLTNQVRNIAGVTTAVARRRFDHQDHRWTRAAKFWSWKVNTINTMVDQL